MNKRIIKYIGSILSGIIILGTCYVAIQQDMRQSANDPQIQYAEDTAKQLETVNLTPESFAGPSIEISESLAPYAVVYDTKGVPVSGTGKLHGKLPTLPEGLLSSVPANGEKHITWQPEAGVRSAIVIIAVKTGTNKGDYIMVGRSLRETEQRERQLALLFGFGTLVMIAAAFGTYFLSKKYSVELSS